MRPLILSALLMGAALPAAAQSAAAPSNVAAVRWTYDMAKDYIIRAAEKMPEQDYGFKPTPEVRSFGGILGHIANANFMICSPAKGEANPNATNFENTTGKAALVKAIRDSFTYCDGAFGMSDAQASAATKLFGADQTRLGVLAFNAAHDFEHYGNLVTYLRLKGIVPPSSEG
jgi:uncharacterized damage-inducible protein DinB